MEQVHTILVVVSCVVITFCFLLGSVESETELFTALDFCRFLGKISASFGRLTLINVENLRYLMLFLVANIVLFAPTNTSLIIFQITFFLTIKIHMWLNLMIYNNCICAEGTKVHVLRSPPLLLQMNKLWILSFFWRCVQMQQYDASPQIKQSEWSQTLFSRCCFRTFSWKHSHLVAVKCFYWMSSGHVFSMWC